EPLTIYGDGRQTRSFCYVSDLIDGFLKLMAYESGDDDCQQPVNTGNDREISMLELVKTIEKILGKPLKIVNNPLPQDDPARRRPDLTRARKVLGYEPKVSLEDGLSKTIDYFRQFLAG